MVQRSPLDHAEDTAAVVARLRPPSPISLFASDALRYGTSSSTLRSRLVPAASTLCPTSITSIISKSAPDTREHGGLQSGESREPLGPVGQCYSSP